MEKTIGLTQARQQLSTIVNEVMHQKDAYVIEKMGKPAAAIVPIDVYRQWKARRERLFELVREVQQRNIGVDPEEVMQDVLAAQQAVRSRQQ